MNIAEWINRWRHNKGYGVHSPLAYDFLREAIAERRGYGYYGYERLEAMAGSSGTGQLERRARLLLRIAVREQPSTVWISPKTPEILVEAVRTAGSVMRIYDGEYSPEEVKRADMIVAWKRLPRGFYKKMREGEATAVCFDIGEKKTRELGKKTGESIVFDMGGSAIVIARKGISGVVYKIKRS